MEYNIEDYIQYKTSEIICLKCLYRWIGIRPQTTILREIHCPNCKEIGYVIETGEEFEVDDKD